MNPIKVEIVIRLYHCGRHLWLSSAHHWAVTLPLTFQCCNIIILRSYHLLSGTDGSGLSRPVTSSYAFCDPPWSMSYPTF